MSAGSDPWAERGAGSDFPFAVPHDSCFAAQIFLQLTCAVAAVCLHAAGSRTPCTAFSALNTARISVELMFAAVSKFIKMFHNTHLEMVLSHPLEVFANTNILKLFRAVFHYEAGDSVASQPSECMLQCYWSWRWVICFPRDYLQLIVNRDKS